MQLTYYRSIDPRSMKPVANVVWRLTSGQQLSIAGVIFGQ